MNRQTHRHTDGQVWLLKTQTDKLGVQNNFSNFARSWGKYVSIKSKDLSAYLAEKLFLGSAAWKKWIWNKYSTKICTPVYIASRNLKNIKNWFFSGLLPMWNAQQVPSIKNVKKYTAESILGCTIPASNSIRARNSGIISSIAPFSNSDLWYSGQSW